MDATLIETPTPAAAPTADRSALRASVLSEIETLEEPKAEPAEKAEPEPEAPAAEEEPDAKPEAPEGEEPAKPEEGDEEPEGDDPPAPATKADPEQEKRLAAIQRAEKRGKEAVAKERETFERQREAFQREWSPRIQAAEQFEAMRERAARDPAGVLEALGVTDMDYAARQAYLRSKAAANDPKAREAADRAMRERETSSVLEQTRAELAAMKREMESQRTQQQVSAWIDTVAKAASDDAPLVRTMLDKSPSKARALISQVAQHLIEQTGETPDPVDVVNALEAHERAELEARGIDYSVIKTSKKTTPVAGERKAAAKTLSNDLGSPKTPRSAPKSRKEEKEELMRDLEEGRIEL